MRYSKPELLTVDTALAAIQGGKLISDFDGDDVYTPPAAYEVDE